MDEYLRSIYFDTSNPAAFTGPQQLYRAVRKEGRFKVTLKEIKNFLKSVDAYTLHKKVNRKFPRNKIQVEGIDIQWDCDIFDLSKQAKYNDNYKYLLACVDAFSRFAFVQPLKTKKPSEVVKAFEKIFSKRKPKRLRTDRGGEFMGRVTQAFLKRESVLHMLGGSEHKACMAERFGQTLKGRLYRYFTHNETYRYVDQLQAIVTGYNRTRHRILKRTPAEVTPDNEAQVWFEQYALPYINKDVKSSKPSFAVGDLVRITYIRKKFERSYDHKWTSELFRISKIIRQSETPLYKLIDYGGEEIDSLFYPQELQSVVIDKDKPYLIDKVIKTRVRKGVKESFVSWKYWGAKFNQWIPTADIEPLRND